VDAVVAPCGENPRQDGQAAHAALEALMLRQKREIPVYVLLPEAPVPLGSGAGKDAWDSLERETFVNLDYFGERATTRDCPYNDVLDVQNIPYLLYNLKIN
jgi:hypothetical protein